MMHGLRFSEIHQQDYQYQYLTIWLDVLQCIISVDLIQIWIFIVDVFYVKNSDFIV